jgi:hypothetical protein
VNAEEDASHREETPFCCGFEKLAGENLSLSLRNGTGTGKMAPERRAVFLAQIWLGQPGLGELFAVLFSSFYFFSLLLAGEAFQPSQHLAIVIALLSKRSLQSTIHSAS